MSIVGLIIVALMMGIGMGSNAGLFLDPLSILIVIGFTLGALLLSRTGVGNMFSAVLSDAATRQQLQSAADAWRQARTYIMAGGWLGMLIGGVIMARNMTDYSSLGPGLGIMVLTLFWAILLGYGVFMPLQKRLEDRAATAA